MVCVTLVSNSAVTELIFSLNKVFGVFFSMLISKLPLIQRNAIYSDTGGGTYRAGIVQPGEGSEGSYQCLSTGRWEHVEREQDFLEVCSERTRANGHKLK